MASQPSSLQIKDATRLKSELVMMMMMLVLIGAEGSKLANSTPYFFTFHRYCRRESKVGSLASVSTGVHMEM